ncbi:hypothetical protein [Paenibacillus sp. BR1-192]|uniref:hypothetical protein n=1 Tax=Paenibacillus sp. BR1-192 TaxID=3032287 RepID=UPI00240E6660|nr:hypothetical protein [Paenibacillus sp. BR1-192]WFB60341.1 hypothetical protein P0X86_09085 [Paenibacillus sp. BR1-192]
MRQGAKGWASAIIALLFFSSLLAACGGNGGGGSGSADSGNAPSGQDNAGSGKPVEVTMITWESAAMNEKIMASMKKIRRGKPRHQSKTHPYAIG